MFLGAGLAAFGAGSVSEALGRKFVSILASLVLIIASVLTAFGWSYWIILAMAPVLGFFVSTLDINMDGSIG